MFNFTRQKRLLLVGVILISIALSIYRIYVIINNMYISPTVENSSYYLDDSFQTYFFAALSVFILIVFLLITIFLKRKLKNCLIFAESSLIFTSSLSGFLILGCVSYYFFYFRDQSEKLSTLSTCIIITAIISSVYFLMNASKKADSSNKTIAWLSLAPIAFFAFRLLNDFIKQSTSPDASSTPYLLVSIIAFLLFFLAEGKFMAGTGNAALYMFFGFSAILFSLIYSLPTLILTSFWWFPTDYTLLYAAIDLTLAMYVAARLFNIQCVDFEENEDAALEKQT